MPQISVNFNGEVSEFDITRITREKLYGKKRRIIVDDEGEQCVSAYLTRDGAALLPSGTTAYLYVTPDEEVVERRDLQAVDDDGNPVEPAPSTLGVEQMVTEPVPPTRVLENVVNAVYQLDGENLGEVLVEALNDGAIFEIRFNYRAGFEDWPAFLIGNDDGLFLLVCADASFDFYYPDTAVDDEDDDDEDPFEDDLDFSMF